MRTVVAGGRPTYGPMQSPAQSRGARMYGTDILDADIDFAREIEDTASAPLPNRTINRDFYVTFASVNLRDEVRQDENVPLQFLYEAANCRIFYTPQTWYNYSALWRYAADAIWIDPALCVQGSVGYATTAGSLSGIKTPPSAAPGPNAQPDMTGVISLSGTPGEFAAAFGGANIIPDGSRSFSSLSGTICTGTNHCPGHFSCEYVTLCDWGEKITQQQCVPTCSSTQPRCTNGALCPFERAFRHGPTGELNLYQGSCIPNPPRICGTRVPNRSGLPPPPLYFEDPF